MWCMCILRGAGGFGKERRCGITYGAQRRSVADLFGVLAVLWMVEQVCDDVERGAAGFAVVARDDVPHYLCVLQVVAVNTVPLACNTLQHTAAHCYTLLHTATHCNALQRTATHCRITRSNRPWAAACCARLALSVNTYCNTPATQCNTLTLHHTAVHCNTLQHTATHCNTLPHHQIEQPVGGGMLRKICVECQHHLHQLSCTYMYIYIHMCI